MMKRKKKSSIGCLFWIALILLLVVIFLLSRSRIENVLETTGFKEIITKNKVTEKPVVIVKSDEQQNSKTVPKQEPQQQPAEKTDKKKPETEIKIEPLPKPEVKQDSKSETQKRSRQSVLYFIKVDESGKISLTPIARTVYYNDSPLTRTMESLLKGLTPSELNKGLISLIPEGTVILGISIKNSTAFINFNETLKFNSFGEEGLKASLKQIVYTSTEFSTVKNVQILINGNIEDYLSTEGVFVGKPLTRASFN